MGDVYKVWDSQRGVFLAIKVLHADLAEDRVFLRRFAREAETLSALQHPHIVRFYGLEQEGRVTFMLMDYVEGTTLRGEIFDAHKPFTVEQVLRILKPVCSALHYAHQMGRVHCDIKPANIMVRSNGEVLIADFGIARMMENSTTTTMAGAGTPAYMAPEQVLGKNPSPQTDIYALGIVLYEMLTGGERPFTGEQASIEGSTSEKVRWEQITLNPPSPRTYNPNISLQLEAVVMKCLEKKPEDRYADVFSLLVLV
jgi:serine/threonine-protein kinase